MKTLGLVPGTDYTGKEVYVQTKEGTFEVVRTTAKMIFYKTKDGTVKRMGPKKVKKLTIPETNVEDVPVVEPEKKEFPKHMWINDGNTERMREITELQNAMTGRLIEETRKLFEEYVDDFAWASDPRNNPFDQVVFD